MAIAILLPAVHIQELRFTFFEDLVVAHVNIVVDTSDLFDLLYIKLSKE